MLLISMNMIFISTKGQNKFILSGSITDENHRPLPGANISVNNSKTGSDAFGNYRIDGIIPGKYLVEISFIGFEKKSQIIDIDADIVFDFQMQSSTLSLQEVLITDRYREIKKKEESLNIEIANDDYLKQNMGGSLMKSLERIGGVTSMDIGSGQSKPVIRGLGFNRVVVVENGIKHEGQQWGADHGLEIDQFAVDNLEVIKGPASIMYGSDAIGGLIDVKQNNTPLDNTMNANVDLTAKSNNKLLGSSVSVSAMKNHIFGIIRATVLDYGDYKVPTDSVDIYSYRAPLYKKHLRNTAGKERDVHFTFGILKKQYTGKVFISNVNSKTGFFANAHGLEPRNVNTDLHDKSSRDILEPFQQVNHFKVLNENQWFSEKWKLETNLGFQRNFRQEWSEYVNHGYTPPVFPENQNFPAELELQFDKHIYSGNAKMSYFLSPKTTIISGLSSDYQDNRISGRGFIIPAFTQTTLGAFVFVKHLFSARSILQYSIRFDFGNLKTTAYFDWFQSPNETNTSWSFLQRATSLNKKFANSSWSIGYNYNLEHLTMKINLGKSFRMPIASELAANGVNYHHFSYEIGNPNLSPEISYQFDAGAEITGKNFVIGITPFANYFTNYIYLNPTAEHDRLYGNGNQIYYYTQSKVFRYGGEIHAHYQIVRNLQLGLIGEHVYSEQLSGEKRGYTLPFSPPSSVIFNIKYQHEKLIFVQNAYFSVDYQIVASQTHIVPPEETTNGYHVVNLSFGGKVRIKNQKINLSFQVQNALNSKYFNHTSYYRQINVPEPARNLILNISIPFTGNLSNKK